MESLELKYNNCNLKTLDGLKNGREGTKERISELEDRIKEITQSEQKKEKINRKK